MFYLTICIEEIGQLSITDFEMQAEEIVIIQNLVNNFIHFNNLELTRFDSIKIYDSAGRIIELIKQTEDN
jgi:hypothetical protein